jgi:hypothetical protein
MAKPWPESTPAEVVMQHRRAWATKDPNVFRVLDRSGQVSYLLRVSPYGIPVCPCPGGYHERPCLHARLVTRRLYREGRRLRPPSLDKALRQGFLQGLPDRALVRLAAYVAPGRDYDELLRQWGRESLVRTILRYEGFAA